MSIMVNREDAVKAINKFIETKDMKDAATLFTYVCELKECNNQEAIKQTCNNPALISFLLPQTIELLMSILNINKITDKNNNLITVF